jgi:uncharacterized protein YkwD
LTPLLQLLQGPSLKSGHAAQRAEADCMIPTPSLRNAILAVALPLLSAGSCPAQMQSYNFDAQSGSDPNRPPAAQNPSRRTSPPPATIRSQKQNAGDPSPDEQSLFEHLNESRVLTGLPALHWDANLAAAARKHCAVMVQHEALSHQFPGEAGLLQRVRDTGAGFSALAENVALAATADEIHYEWMHSPPHRANILDPQLTAVGISVLPGRKGLYAAEDFSLATEKLSLNEQEAKIRQLISDMKVLTDDNPEHTRWNDARQSCPMRDGNAGKPAAVVRFETSDLNSLPPKLQAMLASGKYRSAAVGACDAGDGNSFTRFRLVVLLY